MNEKKIVIVSKTGYSKEHDALIEKLLESEPELISIWGKDCSLWEEIIDELSVGDASNIKAVTTSAHPDEPLEEVLRFAENWVLDSPTEVRVIEI